MKHIAKLRRAGPMLAVCVVMVLFASQSQALLIDHFTEDFTLHTTPPGIQVFVNANNNQLPVADVTSPITNTLASTTTRTTTLTVTGLATAIGAGATVGITGDHVTTHGLSYANAKDVTSMLEVDYTFSAAEDMSVGSFFFLMTASDLGGSAKLFVSDGTDSFESMGVVSIGPGIQAFAYSEFTSNSVDLDHVTEMKLTLIGNTDAFDAQIDSLESGTPVPEPMTMLGLFLGLGGVGAYIRKRRMG